MSSPMWKKAATLIIAAKNSFPSANVTYNYKILFLKRTKSAKVMPGAHVFPGGMIEGADASPQWIHLYNECGFHDEHFVVFNQAANQQSLSKEISLRISAIRETFEESSVLLCKPKMSELRISKWGTFFGGEQIQNWQEKIHQDAGRFIEMCRELQCCPDIWSLQKWSSWLTPTNRPLRFDAVFFIVTLDSIPPTHADNKEITQLEWYTPMEILELNRQSSVWLPNPQLYEIARLRNINSIENINQLTTSPEEIVQPINQHLWLPKMVSTDNGTLTILPGDYMYPENINMYDKTSLEKLNGTNETFRSTNEPLNRIEEYKNGGGSKIIIRNLERTKLEQQQQQQDERTYILPWIEKEEKL